MQMISGVIKDPWLNFFDGELEGVEAGWVIPVTSETSFFFCVVRRPERPSRGNNRTAKTNHANKIKYILKGELLFKISHRKERSLARGATRRNRRQNGRVHTESR